MFSGVIKWEHWPETFNYNEVKTAYCQWFYKIVLTKTKSKTIKNNRVVNQ